MAENQVVDNIVDYVNNELKSNYIKNLIEGSEIAYNSILEMIKQGCSIDDLKRFIELNLSPEGKDVMSRVAGAKQVHNEDKEKENG